MELHARGKVAEVLVEQRHAVEITHVGGIATAPAGTAAFDPAFDVTPPDLITAIVTRTECSAR